MASDDSSLFSACEIAAAVLSSFDLLLKGEPQSADASAERKRELEARRAAPRSRSAFRRDRVDVSERETSEAALGVCFGHDSPANKQAVMAEEEEEEDG